MPQKRKDRAPETIPMMGVDEKMCPRKKRQYETRSQGLMKKAHELAILTESTVHVYISVPGMPGKYQVFLSDFDDQSGSLNLDIQLSKEKIHGEIKCPNDFLTVRQRGDLEFSQSRESRAQDEKYLKVPRNLETNQGNCPGGQEDLIKSDSQAEVVSTMDPAANQQIAQVVQGGNEEDEAGRSIKFPKFELELDRTFGIDIKIPFDKKHCFPTLNLNVQ
ncbi:hypothetical protein TWF718_001554 [Orbilia javanica]|uniref:MADS-box domain-containing protein n=1 Tax=Orbilia javanica TaxID=47235 RepID=A0AAN8N0Y4_9PEZI